MFHPVFIFAPNMGLRELWPLLLGVACRMASALMCWYSVREKCPGAHYLIKLRGITKQVHGGGVFPSLLIIVADSLLALSLS